ncbi:hypothetical protein RD792_002543 [Penstemon davidsonii]|uniref:Kinesin motor domain-containing protein n=1 Tax=Penstemon davidsonii TaxID=160366 RepID=A0ABR0DSE7_9LAMI|nr:hypothetical protein RD792_002543 [Penstemon davidsonii]
MAKPNSQISENSRFFGSISAGAPFKNLLKPKQKSILNRRSRLRSDAENIAPIDPNIQISDLPLSASTSFSKKSPLKPKSNTRKEDLISLAVQEQHPEVPDPPVKVVVRIRQANGTSVRKVSKDSVSVGDRKYKFDSVLDSNSNQGDVYELVGAPLVKDALSGYNTSLVAYGQTGSGKTYTMWGPQSAMVESPTVSGLQGVVPRIFQNLFSQIQMEQENSDDKLINYQCRCSFLEVIIFFPTATSYWLDRTGRPNHGIVLLQIKDDTKNGFYVENLTEEYVSSYEDVTQILIKESSSKCFGSSKTSRISLVDLAGFEKNVVDDASRQHVKEGKYIKKSTSQLGYVCGTSLKYLVNILVEGSQCGKSEDVPYRSSRLTHLLRESFGGNAKLSIICAISPDNKSTSETLSTLRFGLKAKIMKNEPVVNEITEDDVNDLSDQIRQLKVTLLVLLRIALPYQHSIFNMIDQMQEELMRAKSSACNSLSSNDGSFSGRNVRESLNQLRLSLNRSLILPRINNDSEEDLCINENDVKELRLQIDNISNSQEVNIKEDSENGENTLLYSAEGCETNLTCEHYLSCSEESEDEEIDSSETHTEEQPNNIPSVAGPDTISKNSIAVDPTLTKSLSISGCHQSFLQDPVLSESPKIKSSPRKSLAFQDNAVRTSNNVDVLRQSHQADQIRFSLRSSRIFQGPTETLAASLQRGLQIIDYHQKNSASTRSSVSFSFEHLALKPCVSADKVNASVQTSPEDVASSEVEDSSKTWMVAVDESCRLASHETKELEKDLALAIQREKEVNSICKEQAAEIEKLNQLLLTWNGDENHEPELTKEKCEIKEVQEESNFFSLEEREALLRENEILKNKLQSYNTDAPTKRSSDKLRSSLLSQSIQLRKSCSLGNSREEFEKEREKWMEMESNWISLTDELRIDIEYNRQRAEQMEMELRLEKKCTEELDDVLKRSVKGQARMVEHYVELQEKYNDIVVKHRAMMEGIAEVKRAASKAGAKGRHGSRFAKALAAELSALRVERERERELLKKENRSLKIQLKDTAEAVHAAGEVLVRLKEAEETASLAEDKNSVFEEENDKLKKQIEKLKRKHKMEIIAMKQYLAESRLPEAALRPPLYREDSDVIHHDHDDDQAWRAEFGAIYQEHY